MATTIAITIILSVAILTTTSNEPWDKYRLPDTLKPSKYNVTLWPRLEKDDHGMYVFTGHSTVDFECVKETDMILIHSNKLNLTKFNGHHATLTRLDGAAAPAIKTTWLQETTHYLVIQLNGKLVQGNFYQLNTRFQGELADDMTGFYRSHYTEGAETKVLATTQMEPTDARKAFPCFDEPALKAVFHMTLIHNRNTVALANGMETETVNTTMEGVEVSITTFEPTPIMSTYLVVLVVCEFDYIRSPEGGKVLVRVWAGRQAIAEGQGDFALEKAGSFLEFFERYLNVTYRLKKLDHIALPDLGPLAMENWGMITYTEKDLLCHQNQTEEERHSVAKLIAHEVAHMWFGNLVTMKWWNDLWLNEGFATYFSCLGFAALEPDGKLTNQRVWNSIWGAFSVDAVAHSHPLSFTEESMNTPAEINKIFDSITYNKGASVLRMLSEFLTEPVFSKGLSNYLNEFAYKNTVSTDLWKHLQAEVDRTPTLQLPDTIEVIMNRWILQMGFPVITIDTTTGTIRQKHFLTGLESVVDRPSIYNYEWFVPVTWTKHGAPQDRKWLLSQSDVHKPTKTAEWMLANLNMVGFYRVNYDQGNWERLSAQLIRDHKAIPPLNRAQIVDDVFSFAKENIIDMVLALKTTRYLSKETEYTPWVLAHNHLRHYLKKFRHTKVYGAMQRYLRKQVEPLFLHFKNITANWTKIRDGRYDRFHMTAFTFACETGVDSCMDLSRDWFNSWMNNPQDNVILPNLRHTVYCCAVATGGVQEWDFVWQMFKNATDDARHLHYALSCTKDPQLLKRSLQYLLDPTMGHNISFERRIMETADLDNLQPLVWNYIRDNWSVLNDDHNSEFLPKLITVVTERLSTEFDLKQLVDFKAAHTATGSVAKALDQAIERTKANVKWTEENQERLFQWLTSAARQQ
ncbi:aminopeptidase Ey-like isoform X1 [Clupea harengus]|uniref:Aminopeptidase n=1 Tax=Clupea harengus TaxID=7950 RepID=A0A6P3VM67_CLUHA|nr:aminopeptidase Ey-like isoform X1 [Clupea harengus]